MEIATIATGAAGNVIGSLLLETIAHINNLIHLAEHVDDMKTELGHVKNLLSDIQRRIGDVPQSALPTTLETCLRDVRMFLDKADLILDAYRRHKQRLFGGRFHYFERFCLYQRIRGWNFRIHRALQTGCFDVSLINNFDAVLATAPRIWVHPGTGSFSGEQIKYLQSGLEFFLIRTYESRLIVVYGMAGVGKTSLLKNLNNSKEVQQAFEEVIWVTVSRNRSIKDMQTSIAQCISLKLDEQLSDDERALRLNTFLMRRRFLLILDDVWSAIQPERLGVSLTAGRSKILVSTRNKDLARTMNADQSFKMEPLSEEEGWKLFSERAFGGEAVPPEIQEIARKVAAQCEGLPLALNAIAASLSKQVDVTQWIDALERLSSVDDTFLTIHGDFEPEVLHRMKLSYDDLHDQLKPCFLSCAMFPENASIDVEYLIRLWAVELVPTGVGRRHDPISAARNFLQILINRCLVEANTNFWSDKVDYCRLHDIFRYLAIHVAEKENKCLFRAGQNLENFPALEETDDCTKISLMTNKIHSLPEGFKCPTLVTLVLRGNRSLQEIPHEFFESLGALKVLDLSDTNIESLPRSIGDLKSLVYLGLSETEIRSLPSTICQLKCLKYLNLHDCRQLNHVPPAISELYSLESLDILGCHALVVKITGGETASLNDLTEVISLVEVRLAVSPGIEIWKMIRRWTFLRRLTLDFKMQDANVHLDFPVLPSLESVILLNSKMVSLTFDRSLAADIPSLRHLTLCKCPELGFLGNSVSVFREIEIKECESIKTLALGPLRYPARIEMLSLERLHNLETLRTGSQVVDSFGLGSLPYPARIEMERLHNLETLRTGSQAEDPYANLGKLKVWRCEKLKKLPLGLHKRLEVLVGDENWWNGIVWEEGEDWDSMRRHLQSVYRNSSTFTLQDFSIK